MMMIQERDKKIIQVCYEQKFLLMEHVGRYFFGNRESRSARQRIHELEATGWLYKEQVLGANSRTVIRLTPQGIKYARTICPNEVPQPRRLNLNELEHDAIVTSASLRLKELWDGQWIPEAVLKSQEQQFLPDGYFEFESGARAAIEIENSLKGQERTLSLLNRWKPEQVVFVLYIATKPEIYRGFKKRIESSANQVPFGLVKWDELSAGTPYPWSVHGELDLFNRRTF